MLSDIVTRLASPRRAAAMRIGLGVAALLTGVEVFGLLYRLGTADEQALRLPVLRGTPAVTDALAGQIAIVWLILAVLVISGLAARTAAGLLAGLAGLVLLLDQSLYSNHLVLLAVLLALLAATEPAQTWRLGRRRPRPVPFWPLWLATTQLSTMYLFTGLAKLNGQFLSGRVITVHSRAPFSDVFTHEPALAMTVAVLAVVIELAFAVAIWLPPTHRWLLPAAVVFHVGIAVVMLPTLALVAFACITLAAYPAFIVLPRRAAHEPVPDAPTRGAHSDASSPLLTPSSPARRRTRG